MEFSHCEKNETRFRAARPAWLRGVRGSQFLEFVNRGGLAGMLLIEIVKQGAERIVAQFGAQHVKNHRALVLDNRVILIGIRAERSGFRDGVVFLIHQRAHRKILQRLVQSGHAIGLLRIHRFGVAREPVGDPHIGGRGRQHSVSPPLSGGELRQ